MRSIKYILMVCAAAAFAGCTTTYEYPEAQGHPGYSDSGLIEGANRGVNTNYFGPVNSGADAARGPGTPSGTFDVRRP
jgi:hypothetical protein